MVRVKNRYIVVRIIEFTPANPTTGKAITFSDNQLTRQILKYVQQFYGDFGVGLLEYGFRVKYCNDRTKICIIRCRHKAHTFVTSILPLITLICEHRAKFHILYVGATIMQCNKFIVKHQQTFLDRTVGKIVSAKERQDFIEKVMQFDVD